MFIVLWVMLSVVAYFTIGLIAAKIDRPRLIAINITNNRNKEQLISTSDKMSVAYSKIWRHQCKTVTQWPFYLPRNTFKMLVVKDCAKANHVQRQYDLEQMELEMEQERQKELVE
jgi:hypothetical protein